MATIKLQNGDSLELLKQYPDNYFDSVVTDPPYGIGFMGKGWDKPENIAFNPEFWTEVYRVLKPGGHLLAFSASRTYHRMAVAIEDSGFEIRDQIMWIYGSGFPKSQDLGKKLGEEWKGWGSALKPAHEPIVMARKPFKGTLVNNVMENGVGGINIDESRVEFGGDNSDSRIGTKAMNNTDKGIWSGGGLEPQQMYKEGGRFPANVIHDGSEEVINAFPETKSSGSGTTKSKGTPVGETLEGTSWGKPETGIRTNRSDSGSAARFFYGSKCSKADRNEGLEEFEEKQMHVGNYGMGVVKGENVKAKQNNHPTVKPTDLMAYLVRLVTPKDGIVLDPFNGSGSTGKAVVLLNKTENKNYSYVGMELDPQYIKITHARMLYTMHNKTWLEKKNAK